MKLSYRQKQTHYLKPLQIRKVTKSDRTFPATIIYHPQPPEITVFILNLKPKLLNVTIIFWISLVQLIYGLNSFLL